MNPGKPAKRRTLMNPETNDDERGSPPRVIDTKKLTLTAILAAVYALGSFLPGFPVLGLPGTKIDITRSLEMGYGFLLGPIFGPMAAFLGAIVGKLLTGGGFGMYFTPLALVSSFTSATLIRDRFLNVKGWIWSASVLTLLIVGWYLLPTGRAMPVYPVLHFVALGIILVLRGRLTEFLRSEDKRILALGVTLGSYVSTMAGHMLGNLIFDLLVSPPPASYMALLPLVTVERVVIAIISTVIATPLIIVLREMYPELVRGD